MGCHIYIREDIDMGIQITTYLGVCGKHNMFLFFSIYICLGDINLRIQHME